MKRTQPVPKIKVCCISSLTEAQLALQQGADVLGLVGAMPSGPGVITDERIATIVRQLPPWVSTYLLSSATRTRDIIAHHQRTRTSGIQLVDAVPMTTYAQLREALPGIELVQVVHVTGPDVLPYAIEVSTQVDRLLLDSGNPQATVRELGGTGRTHDWAISRQIVEKVTVPVFLAGGLRAHNVEQAIATVQPYGLDLCTGVRKNGQLDAELLGAFMEVVKKAPS